MCTYLFLIWFSYIWEIKSVNILCTQRQKYPIYLRDRTTLILCILQLFKTGIEASSIRKTPILWNKGAFSCVCGRTATDRQIIHCCLLTVCKKISSIITWILKESVRAFSTYWILSEGSPVFLLRFSPSKKCLYKRWHLDLKWVKNLVMGSMIGFTNHHWLSITSTDRIPLF